MSQKEKKGGRRRMPLHHGERTSQRRGEACVKWVVAGADAKQATKQATNQGGREPGEKLLRQPLNPPGCFFPLFSFCSFTVRLLCRTN